MHSIWAVAVNTIRQALRMKVAVVFIMLLLVFLPVLGFVTTGDGTIKGRLQSFVNYGFSLTSFLLCLLTIIVSVYTLTSDIEHKQIYTVLTKPIHRFQLILGKLLGVILLVMGLLVLFSAVIFVIVVYAPRFLDINKTELVSLDNEFFTARASLVPEEEDVTEEVQQLYKRLERTGQLPSEVPASKIARKRYIDALTKQVQIGKLVAEVGHELVWQFDDVKPLESGKTLFIRFRYNVPVNPADLKISGRWTVGDDRQLRYGTGLQTPVYTFDRRDLIRTFHEIEVPTDAVAEDGYLAVSFLNVPQLNTTVVMFFEENAVELLYKASDFEFNYIKGVCLIGFRLIFLACLGVLASSFLSFPVAILLCLAIFFTGTISGFVIEAFGTTLGENLSSVYSYTIIPAIKLLPQFDKFNPSKFLVPGRLISWPLFAEAAGLMVCVKSVLLFAIGVVIFNYREIAKIIV
jgi:ABC-type transport system involved in multi-copper enzyme maturation permease subunit